MSPHEAYCQFLIALESKHISKIITNGCASQCDTCPAEQACNYISDQIAIDSSTNWEDKARDFFSSVDQSLPLSHYREHYPEYFL